MFFPECVTRFTLGLGLWGLRLCSLDAAFATVRNCPQPFAAVRNHPQLSGVNRNRPREGRMAVLMVSSATMVTFEGSKRRIASFCVANVALCDISHVSNMSKVVLCQPQ